MKRLFQGGCFYDCFIEVKVWVSAEHQEKDEARTKGQDQKEWDFKQDLKAHDRLFSDVGFARFKVKLTFHLVLKHLSIYCIFLCGQTHLFDSSIDWKEIIGHVVLFINIHLSI